MNRLLLVILVCLCFCLIGDTQASFLRTLQGVNVKDTIGFGSNVNKLTIDQALGYSTVCLVVVTVGEPWVVIGLSYVNPSLAMREGYYGKEHNPPQDADQYEPPLHEVYFKDDQSSTVVPIYNDTDYVEFTR